MIKMCDKLEAEGQMVCFPRRCLSAISRADKQTSILTAQQQSPGAGGGGTHLQPTWPPGPLFARMGLFPAALSHPINDSFLRHDSITHWAIAKILSHFWSKCHYVFKTTSQILAGSLDGDKLLFHNKPPFFM